MLVLAIIALGGGACAVWDRVADPGFNRNWGWLVKTGLVIAAIVLVIGPLGAPSSGWTTPSMVLLGYAADSGSASCSWRCSPSPSSSRRSKAWASSAARACGPGNPCLDGGAVS